MKILMILLLFSATVLAQTSSEMRRKYGAPVSESFIIRSEAMVIVDYSESEDHKIVSMLIRLKLSETPVDRKSELSKLSTAMDKIVDELVPLDERGKPGLDTFIDRPADFLPDNRVVLMRDYEKLVILYDMEGKQGIYEVNIRWKDTQQH